MGKPAKPRRLPDTEAQAVGRSIRVSPIKLNAVARGIRGKEAGAAMNLLAFSRKGVAKDVRKVLASAIANAENNHNLDIDALFVAEAHVGKNLVMKRWRPRARGRVGRILKPFSQITIILRERAREAEAEAKAEGG